MREGISLVRAIWHMSGTFVATGFWESALSGSFPVLEILLFVVCLCALDIEAE